MFRKFFISYGFAIGLFLSGAIFGFGLQPAGEDTLSFARDAVRVAYEIGRESVIVEVVEYGEIQERGA